MFACMVCRHGLLAWYACVDREEHDAAVHHTALAELMAGGQPLKHDTALAELMAGGQPLKHDRSDCQKHDGAPWWDNAGQECQTKLGVTETH